MLLFLTLSSFSLGRLGSNYSQFLNFYPLTTITAKKTQKRDYRLYRNQWLQQAIICKGTN